MLDKVIWRIILALWFGSGVQHQKKTTNNGALRESFLWTGFRTNVESRFIFMEQLTIDFLPKKRNYRRIQPPERDEIICLYKQGYTMRHIASVVKRSHRHIGWYLRQKSVPIRSRTKTIPMSIKELVSMYKREGLSKELLSLTKLSRPAILRRLKDAGVKTRNQAEALRFAYKIGKVRILRGTETGQWKGGRIIKRGYVEIRVLGEDKYCPEHRLVWEKAHGEIPEGWIVHHLNGVKDDNKLENLQAMPRKQHSGFKVAEPYQERIRELEEELKTAKEA